MKLNKIFLLCFILSYYVNAHGWDYNEPSEYYNENNLPDISLGFILTSLIVLILFLLSIYLDKKIKNTNKIISFLLIIYLLFFCNYSVLEIILMSFALFLFFGLLFLILFCLFIITSSIIKILVQMFNNKLRINKKSI